MTIALLSDIHANIEALEACLRHARANGAERLVFLGDHVGYGASPQAVVERIIDEAARGAIVIKGNHDESVDGDAGRMNESARDAMAWTRTALSADARAFLAGLPLVARDAGMCFVHASAEQPAAWKYVEDGASARASIAAAQAVYTFSGHVHEQKLYFETSVGKVGAYAPLPGSPVPVAGHRRWLAIVGSAGQPRDGNPAAAYALFDPLQSEITFHRVPYDHLSAAKRIRDAGLGEAMAQRIERGV